MTWNRVIYFVVGIIIVIVLIQAWLTSNISPIAPLAPRPKKAPVVHYGGPLIKVEKYRFNNLTPYEFEVHYVVVNKGDQAAKNITLKIHPWQARGNGDGPEDTPVSDKSDPRYSVVKVDTIESLEPGESVERVQRFSNDGTAEPVGRQRADSFDIQFQTE